ncbi:RNA dependent RNA polymerase-domain-containing protein [Biscogniauxia mediterranea]|nr:RNA dependent RNA polymerase-domain-containing protein [Biscogniauxia mediterranea]
MGTWERSRSVSGSVSGSDYQSAVSSVPVTPRKRANAGDFDFWFVEFSNLYNLNLRRPDPTLTPHQKRKLPYYHELVFYDRLKYQYHQGNALELRRRFDQGVREIHTKWVKKPLGEPDVTPSISQLPRATSEPERRQLLELLLDLLNSLSPTKLSRPIIEARSSVSNSFYSNPPLEDPPSPSPCPSAHRSKRRSDEWETCTLSSKKSRSIVGDITRPESPSHLDLDSDQVEMQRPISPYKKPAAPFEAQGTRSSQGKGLYAQPASVNTSRSTFVSQVFSERDRDEPLPASQETQITVEASTQEKMRLPPPASDSDSLAPSSSTERALELSFERHFYAQQRTSSLFSRNVPLTSSSSEFDFPQEDVTAELDKTVLPETRATPPTVSPGKSPAKLGGLATANTQDIERRLRDVWPSLPSHLDAAPLAVRWEILRIALHCGINIDDLRIEYDASFTNQTKLWERLRSLPIFAGKSFPEKSRPEAWAASLSDKFCSTDQVVVLGASLSTNTSKTGPLFHIELQPLKLELPHRLDRRFGSDRFLEVVMPSMSELKAFESIHDDIYHWLVRSLHVFIGRIWTSFFVKPSSSKKVSKEDTLMPETKTIHQDRVYFFAEDGNDLVRHKTGRYSEKGESFDSHTKMGRDCLLDWLLQIEQNKSQSVLKLFSRIALGLSRTHPTVILQPDQIRHREEDILSPIGKVMNDGISRMSMGLARRVRDMMGLDDIPAGYQGRFGSAKGFWLRDTTDTSDDVWIETSPSQRKWKCDYAEEDHRTFEVRNGSKELKSAHLNLQLLPILEDRAISPSKMRLSVGNFMRNSLLEEMQAQKTAMQDPAQFRLWVYENSPAGRRQDRVRLNHVPWTAGLPTSREDQMELLLSQGFDPTKLEFLRKIAWSLRKEKCEELQSRLNVKIGRSTYAFMVVDFLGVLEEDEVHLGFSSKFSDDQSGFCETFLHGMDVLVARTPAHYPSDIQRVKAVFKPELGSLKDVIIFPTKGNTALAEKLSGGDYDGDIAWVCWEPTIVENFANADDPIVPDLFKDGTLSKNTQKFEQLGHSQGTKDVIPDFLDQAFQFNMQQNLLGVCTNYKEKLCYSRNSVRDEPAIFLSTLISHLVDRAKQGIIFTMQDWSRLRKELNGKQLDPRRRKSGSDPLPPKYKNNDWDLTTQPTHIIDFVKFAVGKPTIDAELAALDQFLNQAVPFDKDLVRFYQYYEKLQRPFAERAKAKEEGKFKMTTWEIILEELKKDIERVAIEWANSRDSFSVKLSNAHDKWQKIVPTNKANSKTIRALREEGHAAIGLSPWDLLKASFCFKMYYSKYSSFPWYVAGWQLGVLKAIYTSQDAGAPPVLMTPSIYAGSRPDTKFVRSLAAMNEGLRYDGGDDDEEDVQDEDA